MVLDGIAFESVTKAYGERPVLRDVSFAARPGRITAFIGPNGAGKSTSLKVLAGITTPNSGRALIDGEPLAHRAFPGTQVGFSLDATAFHPGRTVAETYLLACMLNGVPRRTDGLNAVGLDAVRRRRVGKLSLGMRQRLALACALSGEPRHLVLDEPMNGLDVDGVLWVRELLRTHVGRGGAVLVSSHLLGELETLADRFVFLDRGAVVAQLNRQDLLVESSTIVGSADAEALSAALMDCGAAVEPTHPDPNGGPRWRVACAPQELSRYLVGRSVPVNHLTASTSTLQDTFLELTQGEFAAQGEARRGS